MRSFLLNFSLLVILTSCKKEIVPEPFYPTSEHENYQHSLEIANLSETALGRDWIEASAKALEQPLEVRAPYSETFYLEPSDPDALGYRFSALKGQKIEIDIDPELTDPTVLFVDLFRLEDDAPGIRTHVATADSDEHLLGFEPRTNATYVVRLQPELLRGGRFNVSIRIVPSLRFPVTEGRNSDIGSFFGDPRDGGRRKHHGVDIFARRHTPIIAPTDGYVRFTGERGLGGLVVWLRDEKRNQNLYFAHLQKILVQSGTYVQEGDTLGTVGNTGNARTTPPHLHFGIYSRGPQDPYAHIAHTKSNPEPVIAEVALLGSWVRTTRRAVFQSMESEIPDIELDRFQLMKAVAAAGSRYRVELPDGSIGTISAKLIESAEMPLEQRSVPSTFALLESPATNTLSIESVVSGSELLLLGRFMEYWYVRNDGGREGWVLMD